MAACGICPAPGDHQPGRGSAHLTLWLLPRGRLTEPRRAVGSAPEEAVGVCRAVLLLAVLLLAVPGLCTLWVSHGAWSTGVHLNVPFAIAFVQMQTRASKLGAYLKAQLKLEL